MNENTKGGERGGKTERAINAVKSYIGGMSKQEKERIQRELEQEEEEEEKPTIADIVFRGGINIRPVVTNWYNNDYIDNMTTTNSPWTQGQWIAVPKNFISNPQKREIEEEVQDVNFEE